MPPLRCARFEFKLFRIVVLRAQFAAGGHFVWDITIKYFNNPSYNKAILLEFSIIVLDSYSF